MNIENEPKYNENFIGNMQVGITLELIKEHLQKGKEELQGINKKLSEKNCPDILRKAYKEIKSKTEGILSVSPDEIFNSIQEIYNFVRELEKNKLKKDDILQKIKNEKPDLFKNIIRFYGILRDQEWGYKIGQGLFGFIMKDDYHRNKER